MFAGIYVGIFETKSMFTGINICSLAHYDRFSEVSRYMHLNYVSGYLFLGFNVVAKIAK